MEYLRNLLDKTFQTWFVAEVDRELGQKKEMEDDVKTLKPLPSFIALSLKSMWSYGNYFK